MATKRAAKEQAYYTTVEAGEYLRLSPDVIKAAAHAGRLPGKRTSGQRGKFLFRKDDLDAFFEQLEEIA